MQGGARILHSTVADAKAIVDAQKSIQSFLSLLKKRGTRISRDNMLDLMDALPEVVETHVEREGGWLARTTSVLKLTELKKRLRSGTTVDAAWMNDVWKFWNTVIVNKNFMKSKATLPTSGAVIPFRFVTFNTAGVCWSAQLMTDFDGVTVICEQESVKRCKNKSKILKTLLDGGVGWSVKIIESTPINMNFTVRLTVIVSPTYVGSVSVVKSHLQRAYYHSTWHTKATLYVPLRIHGHRLLIFGSHLPFDPKADDLGKENRMNAMRHVLQHVNAKGCSFIWMGDLNYRVDATGTDTTVNAVSHVWRDVTGEPADALEFHRGPEPTCKVVKTSKQNAVVYDSKRTPSYCDQLIVMSKAEGVHTLVDRTEPFLAGSDHIGLVFEGRWTVGQAAGKPASKRSKKHVRT